MDLLGRWAAERGISVNHDEELIAHPQVIALVQEEVDRLMQDVSSYERIKKIALLPAPLTIEGGELTPTLKARRRVIETKYRDVIDALYQES
jgi:long-chain acyl-CoA synthetase